MNMLKRLLAFILALSLIGTLTPMQAYAENSTEDAPALYAAGTSTDDFYVLQEGTAKHHNKTNRQIYRFQPQTSGWYCLVIENLAANPGSKPDYTFNAGVNRTIYTVDSQENIIDFSDQSQDSRHHVYNSTRIERLIWLKKDDIYEFYCKPSNWIDPDKIDIALTISKKADITGASLEKAPTEPSIKAFIGTGMQIAFQHADNTRTISDVNCTYKVYGDSGSSTNILTALDWNAINSSRNAPVGYNINVHSIDGQEVRDVDFSKLIKGTHNAKLRIRRSDSANSYYEIETNFEAEPNNVKSLTVTSSDDTYTGFSGDQYLYAELEATYEDGSKKTITPEGPEHARLYFSDSPSKTSSVDYYLSELKEKGELKEGNITAEVTAEYMGMTTTYSVTISPNPYSGISVTAPKKTVYYAGANERISIADIGEVSMDLKGGGTRSFSSLNNIPGNSYPYTDTTDLRYSKYGIKTGNSSYVTSIDSYLQTKDAVRNPEVTVTYLDYTAIYPIEIRDVPYDHIEIAQTPTQTTYPYSSYSRKLSLNGLVFHAYREDGDYDTYTYEESEGNGDGAIPNWKQYFSSPALNSNYYNSGEHEVSISFMNLKVSFKIQVEEKPVTPEPPKEPVYTDLKVHTLPTRTSYYTGENISCYDHTVPSLEGLVLELTDSDGVSKLFQYNKNTTDDTYESWSKISSYIKNDAQTQIDWRVPGTYDVTITYEKQKGSPISASFPIRIVDSPIKSVEIIREPTNKIHVLPRDRGSINLLGMTYKITFDDGSIYARTINSDSSSMTFSYQGRIYEFSPRWSKTSSNGFPTPPPSDNCVIFSVFGKDYCSIDSIRILNEPVTSIAFVKNPVKMTYTNRNNFDVDLYGAKIKIDYADNTSETITFEEHTDSAIGKKYGELLQAEFHNRYFQHTMSQAQRCINVTYLNETAILPVTISPKELNSSPIEINGKAEITLDKEHPYQIVSFKPQAGQEGCQFYCTNPYTYMNTYYQEKPYIELYKGNYYLNNKLDASDNGWLSPFTISSYECQYWEKEAPDENFYFVIYVKENSGNSMGRYEPHNESTTFQCYLRPSSEEDAPGEIKDVAFNFDKVKKTWYTYEFKNGTPSLLSGLTYTLTYENGWTETKCLPIESGMYSSIQIGSKTLSAEWKEIDPDPDNNWIRIPTGPENAIVYTYDEETHEVPVTITDSPIESIEITENPLEDIYDYQPTNFSLEGLSVTVNYKDSATKPKTVRWTEDSCYKIPGGYAMYVDGYSMSANLTYNSNSLSLKIQYMGEYTQVDSELKPSPINSFTLNEPPEITGLYPFEPKNADLYGMDFTISYRNGETQDIKVTEHGSSVPLEADASTWITSYLRDKKDDQGKTVYSLYLQCMGHEQEMMTYSLLPIANAQEHIATLNTGETKYEILKDDNRYAIFQVQGKDAGKYTFQVKHNMECTFSLYDGSNQLRDIKADISSDYSPTDITCEMEGEETLYLVVFSQDPSDWGSVSCTLKDAEAAPKTPIPSAGLTVDIPIAETTLPMAVPSPGSQYQVKSQWYGGNEDGTAAFATAHRLRLELIPNKEYCFTSDTRVTLNGTALTDISSGSNGSLILYYTFPTTECKINLPKVTGYTLHTDSAGKPDRAQYGGSFAFQYLNQEDEPDRTLTVKANGNIVPLGEDGFYRIKNITENIDIFVKSSNVTPEKDDSMLILHDRSEDAYDIILGKQNHTLQENTNGENTLPLLPSYIDNDEFFFGWYLGKDANLNGTNSRFTSMSKLLDAEYNLYAKWGSGIFDRLVKGTSVRYQILSFDEYNKMTVQIKSIGKQKAKSMSAFSTARFSARSEDVLEIPATLNPSSLEEDMGIDIESCTVVAVDDYAFAEETDIKSVLLPDTIRRIGANAFSNCTGLEEITIPDGVTEIGANAFEGCSSLHRVVIPSSVTKLSEGTFRRCQDLTVVLPDTIQEIEPDAFSDTSNITIICGSSLADSDVIQEIQAEGMTVQAVDIIPNCTGKLLTYNEEDSITAEVRINGETAANRELAWRVTDADAYSCREEGDSLLITPKRVTAEDEQISVIVTDVESARTVSIPLHTKPADLSRKGIDGEGLYLVEVADGQTYSGEELCPSVTVRKASSVSSRLEASEYEVSYSDNINAGIGKVTVTGKGNYSGSISQTFTIDKAAQTITASDIARTTKNFIVPLNAKSNGNGRLSYTSSNENVATVDNSGIATIRGIGVTRISIQASETENYKESKPTAITLTVKEDESDIPKKKSQLNVPRIFYTKTSGNKPFYLNATAKTAISYKSSNPKTATVNNSGKVTLKKCGKSIITVKTSDKQVKVTIYVLPKKASAKVSSNKAGQLQVSWKMQQEASGYTVEYSTDKSFRKKVGRKTLNKNKTTSVTLKKLPKGKKYYVRVRAYTLINKEKTYGAVSKTVSKKVKK